MQRAPLHANGEVGAIKAQREPAARSAAECQVLREADAQPTKARSALAAMEGIHPFRCPWSSRIPFSTPIRTPCNKV